ncbi:DUF5682 family protein [Rheinheimera baltica]|uniref:DUF5682 family protein n=1 Tax=Rheinheimera baltica TaxID=67576 RepID=A0ABT9HV89_9GAMM|nr:DUF5682 family protein [Rheinheimera baltica]MDP5135044.1 DUF5682 family protein [Rheinheimera baltica]
MAESPFHLFGVRHHGPGCARSLLAALHSLEPDCLLVEGPPDGEAMLPLVLDDAMVPPVALLIYNPDESQQASFYPFAEFSPEWQALRYALARGIETRFIDLPITHQFALRKLQTESDAEAESAPISIEENAIEDSEPPAYGDPLDWLAQAAGHGDGESWWNYMIEERCDGLELFAAIREAMTSLREEAPLRQRNEQDEHREALREAHMRKCMRQAAKDGFTRIAVVCGAWHLPALENLPSAKADNDLLKGLPKSKVAATWVPWSYQNLCLRSGYGAGVDSPAWYEHLWQATNNEQRSITWLAKAARLLRENDIDCSSAHIIEAVRLADALAALRERPQAGLDELSEALRTLVCMDNEAPMQLIHRQLIVGEKLGAISPQAPAVPLQRDIEQQQKSLRLKPEATQKNLDLDLRQTNDLARSHLLHRLNLLDIRWGALNRTGHSAKGSFHEIWTLQWEPELAIAIIDASRWGNTLSDAATHKAVNQAQNSQSLPQVSELVQKVLLADLQAAIVPVTQALENLTALASDVTQLLAAIPALSQIARYGNVRNTDVGMVEHILQSLIPRAAIGLPGACSALDDNAAQTMREHLVGAHQAVRLLAQDELNEEWFPALRQLTRLDNTHGLIAGLAARLLFDSQEADTDTTAIHMNQALSLGNDPAAAAAWVEGFLNQSGMILLHDAQLWALLNSWLNELTGDHFTRALPLLRRTFATFSAPERRQLGERAQRPGGQIKASAGSTDFNLDRAEQTIPLLRALMGLPQ